LAGPLEVLARLGKAYGDLAWWPVDTAYHAQQGTDPRFEIVVGAILTQNTTWTSVEQALANLKAKKLLDAKRLNKAGAEVVREAIRPAGSFNQKASYLLGIAKYLATTYKDGLDPFFRLPTKKLREILLSFNGIGPETADDILVYAAKRSEFIVDAYARRLTKRLGWGSGDEPYTTLQDQWGKRLGTDPDTYAKAHALIVEHCKIRCTHKAPACPGCPLEPICPRIGVEPTAYLKAAQSGNVAKPPR
jgi:endonuclease III related protein